MSTTGTRRDRRERERERRGRDHRSHTGTRGRSTRIGGQWIALGVVVVALALFFGLQALGVIKTGPPPVADLNAPKFSPAQTVGVQSPDEGNTHVTAGQTVTYKTNPPTSGSHWGQPAGPVPWGTKDTQLQREAVLHNMEHGGIIVWYKALGADEKTKLTDLVSQLRSNGYPKIVLMPYNDMSDAKIALTSWTWSLKLQAYDDAQIVQFVRAHHAGPDAPEPGAP
ncbi:MAG: DUF3105 domain-containing protein [Chloroflexi bacterium]|nr:DUF3105 domain-containing protein [Chloroflexota bacterium]